MADAWLSLGGNIGDPTQQITDALELLEKTPKISISKKSSMLINPPWGKVNQPNFHNMTIEISTLLEPIALLDACQNIENILGRVRGEKWGPRNIDIDIIAYEQLILSVERLNLPHHHAHEREFVLQPLREISPTTAQWILELKAVPET
ncbi:2-amino-4-hydroxy-6-hydroxymethyldihydropteridinepyrophosphokinase [hydrothermal vent metagenome]|uniref:2-amino-4-hydroxy-6-hydroxymethyldihydropteridine diphosphokinase n=1 Tax=hydrothermal vent metagenome TaxID=652676 RepID=A0A3B0UHN8_9ZZZZ